MKHDWAEYRDPKKSRIEIFLSPEQRICSTCGAIQTRVNEQAWMRIVSRYWRPLVGRCRGSANLPPSTPCSVIG